MVEDVKRATLSLSNIGRAQFACTTISLAAPHKPELQDVRPENAVRPFVRLQRPSDPF